MLVKDTQIAFRVSFRIMSNRYYFAVMLTLYQALDIINSGEPFTLGVCTCDEQKRTGGEMITLGPALLNSPKRQLKSQSPAVRKAVKRFSNNDDNDTLTIRIIGTDLRRTIHKQLIFFLNGIRVV